MIGQIQFKIEGDLNARERAQTNLPLLPGLEEVSLSDDRLSATYEVPAINAATVVEALEASGVTPVLSWLQRLRLWLRYYREAIFEENLNDESGWESCVREIYVSRYRHRRHGRRDDRPRHWRQYLTPPPNE
jgi:hypothetical protein